MRFRSDKTVTNRTRHRRVQNSAPKITASEKRRREREREQKGTYRLNVDVSIPKQIVDIAVVKRHGVHWRRRGSNRTSETKNPNRIESDRTAKLSKAFFCQQPAISNKNKYRSGCRSFYTTFLLVRWWQRHCFYYSSFFSFYKNRIILLYYNKGVKFTIKLCELFLKIDLYIVRNSVCYKGCCV